MRIFLSKTLLICFLLQPYAIAQNNCERAKLIVSNFVNSKQNKDWSLIRRNAYKLDYCKCEMAPVFYYIYRMRVLLPNSHALHDISPDDFVSSQELKMKEQLNTLKSCEEKSYLPLIDSMIMQDFDEEMIITAKELRKKLSTIQTN